MGQNWARTVNNGIKVAKIGSKFEKNGSKFGKNGGQSWARMVKYGPKWVKV